MQTTVPSASRSASLCCCGARPSSSFFGLLGLILGPFIGAVLGELAHTRNASTAAKVGFGTWLGMVFGALVKLALAFVMLGIFLFALAF